MYENMLYYMYVYECISVYYSMMLLEGTNYDSYFPCIPLKGQTPLHIMDAPNDSGPGL